MLRHEMVEEILSKVKTGAMTTEEAKAAIKRLIDEAGDEVSRAVEDSPVEQRIRHAAQMARRLA